MKDGEDMAEQHQAQDQHEQTAEELHELKRIRREKLAELQAAGKDPFQQVALSAITIPPIFTSILTSWKARPSVWQAA